MSVKYYLQSAHVHVAAWVRAFCANALPSSTQHYVDLHVHKQGDDEGYIEGHNRRVDYKGRICDYTQGFIMAVCKFGAELEFSKVRRIFSSSFFW